MVTQLRIDISPVPKGMVGGSNPLGGTQAMAMVHFGSLPLFISELLLSRDLF